VPEVVAPHQSVRGIIHIAGDQLPAIRNVTIHLETSDPMKSLTIPVKFGTGMVPCIQPPHATFRDIGEEMTAATNLWVEAQKGDRFAIESTEFEVEIQRGERHALTETPTIVAIREDGLCCLPLLLRLKGDAVSRGSGSITYTCAHEVRAVRVPYSIVQEECIAISPASVEMYFGRGQQQSLERVFVATAPFQFAPEVVESPDFCNARFEKISERSWKLIAAVNPNDLPDGIAGFEIRVASSAAGKDKIYRDRCLINVVDKRSREGADDR
jgi:hypothetical protein